VRVITDVLNVRKGAGTNHNVVTTVKMNEVYTIIEEKVVGNDVWGRLKSQVGWICLTYTKKL
jgi:N-acetylmuramoyl-L-alanine amidase